VDDQGQSPVAQLPGADLAPRDAVSRALVQSMRERQLDHLWLDLRPVGPERLERQFPTILGRCRDLGLEPTAAPIPVAPAAHYWMGGIRTDLQAATTLPGLYAVGEVASSGVHGANRLASNSLMECLVFARQLRGLDLGPAESIGQRPAGSGEGAAASAAHTDPQPLEQQLQNLRQLCWQVAGVERQPAPLQQALLAVRHQASILASQELLDQVARQPSDGELRLESTSATWLRTAHDLRQRLVVAELLLEAALFRRESRGGHYRLDAPAAQPFWLGVRSSFSKSSTLV